MSRLTELNEKMASLHGQARAIMDHAKADNREITAEESVQVDGFYAEFDACKAEAEGIEAAQRRSRNAEQAESYLNASPGRITPPNPVEGAANPAGQPARPAAPELTYRGNVVRLEPGSPEQARAREAYRVAFNSYLSGGPSAGLIAGSNPKGGYLVPMQMSMSIIKALDDAVFMRQLATVLPPLTVGTSLGVPSLDTDLADADWTPEIPASDLSEDDALAFGGRELTPHWLPKLVKLSRKLLRAASIDPETIVRERLVYKLGITMEKAYLTGNGVKKPLGVFVASNDGIPTTRDVSCASQTEFTADELIDCKFACKGQYQANGSWLMHRDTVKRARKLKDGTGQYLWTPGLTGQPSTILERPYYMSEYAPNTFTSGLYVALFGDFKAGYWIVDSLQIAIDALNELFRLKNQMGLIAEVESDGMPVMAEAFSRLKLA